MEEPIQFQRYATCPSCNKPFRARHEHLMKSVRCPNCATVFKILSLEIRRADSPQARSQESIQKDVPLEFTEGGSPSKRRPPDQQDDMGRIGRFELKCVLGRGGYGTVYKAFDPVLGRTIALKVPRFSLHEKGKTKRFVTEAKSAAKLRHPNIVAVFDAGQTDAGEYFIASEYIDGQPLSAYVGDGELSVDLSTKVAWIRDLASALAYAHSEGIVHRDVKSDNILVDRQHHRAQLADFGLAKHLDDNSSLQTQDGSVLGTPAYMSPEQARGETSSIGPASDQYSLGIVLYELLCGRRPFSGPPHEVLVAVASHREPPLLREVNAVVSPDLEAICAKSIAKCIDDRYPTIAAFADDLSRWLNGDSVQARPLRRLTRFARWARREPILSTLSGLVAILAAASLLASIWLWRSTSDLGQALKIAEQERSAATRSNELAQRKEREASDALEQLKSEAAARQQAELEKTAELERRLQIAEELREQSESLSRSETERQEAEIARSAAETKLEASTVARTAAELTANQAEKERDRIRSESDWLTYTDCLSEADLLLERNEKNNAFRVLQRCPEELRAWEWHYLQYLSRGMSPRIGSMMDPAVRIESMAIAKDVASFVAGTTRPSEMRVYGVSPLALISEIKGSANSSVHYNVSPSVALPDGLIVVEGLGYATRVWALQGSKAKRLRYERASSPADFTLDGSSLCYLTYDANKLSKRNVPAIKMITTKSGQLLRTVELDADPSIEYMDKLILGPSSYFVVTGRDKASKNDMVWVFKLDQTLDRIQPIWEKKIELGTGIRRMDRLNPEYAVTFSDQGNRLLISRLSGYFVYDTATGELIASSVTEPALTVAISADGRRVISLGTEGITLRDCITARTLPRLRNLPWSRWGTRVRARHSNDSDVFAINSKWTRCVASGDPVDKPQADGNKATRAIYSWQIESPVVRSE